MIDLNNPKIVVVHGALMNVLASRDVEKINDYFTQDAVLIINEKKLQGEEIYKRIEWLKKNSHIKSVIVKLHKAFFDGNEGFDFHTTEVLYHDNTKHFYKIFGFIKLREFKICHYEDVTIQLEGEKNMEMLTSTT